MVKDKTGKSLAGVTVVATSPALQGTQAELTDDTGRYTISWLPPGVYLLTFYYSEIVLERKGIDVGLSRQSTVNQTIDTTAKEGDSVIIGGGYCAHLTTDCGGRYSLVVDKDYIGTVQSSMATQASPCQ